VTGLLFLLGVLAMVLGGLVYFFKKDRQFLQGHTRDALSPTIKKEIAAEIEDAKRRQQLFRQSLENAAKLAKSQDNSLTSGK
jgi:hypothetical protein